MSKAVRYAAVALLAWWSQQQPVAAGRARSLVRRPVMDADGLWPGALYMDAVLQAIILAALSWAITSVAFFRLLRHPNDSRWPPSPRGAGLKRRRSGKAPSSDSQPESTTREAPQRSAGRRRRRSGDKAGNELANSRSPRKAVGNASSTSDVSGRGPKRAATSPRPLNPDAKPFVVPSSIPVVPNVPQAGGSRVATAAGGRPVTRSPTTIDQARANRPPSSATLS